MSIIFLILAIVFLVLWRKASKQASAAQEESSRLTQSLDSTKTDVENLRTNLASAAEKERELESKVSTLSKYQGIADVDAEIQKKRAEADTEILSLKTAAAQELSDAKQDAKEIRAKGRADYDLSLIHI